MFKLVTIIPIEDTYFIREEIPDNIRLSKNFIKLNYFDRSPYKNGDVIFLKRGNDIYIWFTKYSLNDNKIYIPEGYLLVRNSKLNTGFLLIDKKSSFSIIVVKFREILSQITYKRKPENIEEKIKLLSKEYSLKNPEVLTLTEKDLDSYHKYDIKDIILFLRVDFTKENIIKFIISNISIPLSVIFFGLSLYKIADYYYLVNKKEMLESQYLELKRKNRDIKEKIRLAQEKSNFWRNFVNRELKYPLAPFILYKIAKVIIRYEGFINNVSFSQGVVSMIVGLPKKREKFIENLMKTGLFKDIKILTTSPDRLSKDYEILSLELYIKKWVKDEK